jgi:hypothetical protein
LVGRVGSPTQRTLGQPQLHSKIDVQSSAQQHRAGNQDYVIRRGLDGTSAGGSIGCLIPQTRQIVTSATGTQRRDDLADHGIVVEPHSAVAQFVRSRILESNGRGPDVIVQVDDVGTPAL